MYIYTRIFFWKNRMREHIGSIVKGRIAADAAAAAALKLTERKTWKIKHHRSVRPACRQSLPVPQPGVRELHTAPLAPSAQASAVGVAER